MDHSHGGQGLTSSWFNKWRRLDSYTKLRYGGVVFGILLLSALAIFFILARTGKIKLAGVNIFAAEGESCLSSLKTSVSPNPWEFSATGQAQTATLEINNTGSHRCSGITLRLQDSYNILNFPQTDIAVPAISTGQTQTVSFQASMSTSAQQNRFYYFNANLIRGTERTQVYPSPDVILKGANFPGYARFILSDQSLNGPPSVSNAFWLYGDVGIPCPDKTPHCFLAVRGTPADPFFSVDFDTDVEFAGWQGACASAGLNPHCDLVINDDTTVTATYYNLSNADIRAQGPGTITVDPAPIHPASSPESSYYHVNANVTVTPHPDANAEFAGYSDYKASACTAPVVPAGVPCTIKITGYNNPLAVNFKLKTAQASTCPTPDHQICIRFENPTDGQTLSSPVLVKAQPYDGPSKKLTKIIIYDRYDNIDHEIIHCFTRDYFFPPDYCYKQNYTLPGDVGSTHILRAEAIYNINGQFPVFTAQITVYKGGGGTTPPTTVAAPTITPGQSGSGPFTAPLNVSISSSTGGASIRYTKDGSSPSATAGAVLANGGSFAINSTTTIKAIAYKTGTPDSPVSSATFTIQTPGSPPPAAVPSITSFSASPTTITAGQSTTFSWVVTGATSLSIDQGIGAVTSTSKSVNPSASAEYKLTATNSSGSTISQPVHITVNPPLPPTSISCDAFPPASTAGTRVAEIQPYFVCKQVVQADGTLALHVGFDDSNPIPIQGLDKIVIRVNGNIVGGQCGGEGLPAVNSCARDYVFPAGQTIQSATVSAEVKKNNILLGGFYTTARQQ